MTIPPATHPKPIKTTSTSSPSLTREPSSSRASFESFMSDDEDIFMTIETRHEPEFVAVEPPSLSKTTNYESDNKPESREKERQISIDPMSIRASNIRQASFRLVSPPPSTTTASKSSSPHHNNTIPLPQPPPRLKFVNSTDNLPLPSGSSASSSPEPKAGSSSLLKNKVWKSESDIVVVSTQLRGGTNLSHQRSSMDDTQLLLEERRSMRRNMISISDDQGRSSGTTAPAVVDDFELRLDQKPIDRERMYYNNNNNNNSFEQAADHHHDFRTAGGSRTRWSSKKGSRKNSRNQQLPPIDDRFNKCGKLCLFLPRGKGKSAVRSASTVSTVSSTASTAAVGFSLASSQKRTTHDDDDHDDDHDNNHNNNHHNHNNNNHPAALASISKRVSLEKFECGSWSSASFLNDYDDGGDVDSASLFFDLPDEMIRCSISDMQSPVTAAFLFDGKQDAIND